MYKSIVKYEIELGTILDVNINKESKMVLADGQNGKGFVWFEVDRSEILVSRKFYIVGTGEMYVNEFLEHRFSFKDGSFVWHVLEKLNG